MKVGLFPKPVQDMPPFYTAIVGNPDSYRQAAAADIGVITNLMSQSVEQLSENIALYRRTRQEHGLDPAAGRVVVLLHTYLGADTEQARAQAYDPFCAYLRSSLSLFGQVTNSLGFTIDLEDTPPEDVEYLLQRAYERYCADRALIGNPADSADIVRRLVEVGADEIACFVDFGLSLENVSAGLPYIGELRRMFGTDSDSDSSTLDSAPMTSAQQRIWFLDHAFPDRPTYTESLVVRLDGPLNVDALRQALQTVVDRHAGLRSVFREVDGQPRQVILPPRPVALPVRDATGGTVTDVAAELALEETRHTFDLATGPLFEPRLVRLADDQHLLVLRAHHLVLDTISAEIITREVSAGYRAAIEGVPVDLPVPGDPLAPGETESEEQVGEDLAYWREVLGSQPPQLALPTDRPRPVESSGRGGATSIRLGTALTERLREFSRANRATCFQTLLAGFAIVLRRLSGQSDLVLGTPVAHRPEGTQDTVGFFVNTLPLRIQVADDGGFADLVRTARAVVLDAQDHQATPFADMVRTLGGDSDRGRNPIFDVSIEFDNAASFEFDLPDVQATLLDAAVDRAPFDLAMFLTNLDDDVHCQLNFAVDLFDPATASRILDQFRLVLDAAIGQPDHPVGSLPAIADSEAALLAEWQDGGPAPETAGVLHAELAAQSHVVDRAGQPELAGARRPSRRSGRRIGRRGGEGGRRGGRAPAPQRGCSRRHARRVARRRGVPPVGPGPAAGPPDRDALDRERGGRWSPGPRCRARFPWRCPRSRWICSNPDPRSPCRLRRCRRSRSRTCCSPPGRPECPRVASSAIARSPTRSRGTPGTSASPPRTGSRWFSSPGFDPSGLEVWPALRTGARSVCRARRAALRPGRPAGLADRERHHRGHAAHANV